jgi:hypothetical protein
MYFLLHPPTTSKVLYVPSTHCTVLLSAIRTPSSAEAGPSVLPPVASTWQLPCTLLAALEASRTLASSRNLASSKPWPGTTAHMRALESASSGNWPRVCTLYSRHRRHLGGGGRPPGHCQHHVLPALLHGEGGTIFFTDHSSTRVVILNVTRFHFFGDHKDFQSLSSLLERALNLIQQSIFDWARYRVSCETDFFSFGSNRNKPKHWQFRFCFGIYSERI